MTTGTLNSQFPTRPLTRRLLFYLAMIGLMLIPGQLRADPIIAGTTTFNAIAIQDVTVFANTSINPGSEIFFDDLSGTSFATIIRDEQVGSTINISGLDGWVFEGSGPLGGYRFGLVGPFDGDDYSGSITNVVQDPSDPGFPTGDPSSFVSGDYFVSGSGFGFEFTSGPLTGVVLRTDAAETVEFEATFDGLPPSPGTLITPTAGSAQVLDIYLTNGNGDLLELVGQSSDRRILVVPEPSSIYLLGFCSLIFACRNRKRRAN